jgi:hypothetical protein
MGRFLLRIEFPGHLSCLTRPSGAIGFRWVFQLPFMGGFLSHHGIKLEDLVVKRKLKPRFRVFSLPRLSAPNRYYWKR